MTERLYYTNPYLRSFDATVARVESRGGRTVVFLDRSAFYPTSGGQPFDVGTLGSCRVVDVEDDEDGEVAHVVDGDGADCRTVGATVHGEIEWMRRFDHMQQHTGQHVLSAAFSRLFGAKTVSFHLGAEVSTIDLARDMTPAEIATAEAEANRIVWEDRPVAIRFASKDEAAQMPLRKEPKREGTLRLIDVEDFDLSACGGTHVARTGGIGIIAVASWERFKGGQRLEFLCGGRALTRFRANRDIVSESVRLLSVLPEELPPTITRMLADAKDQKRSTTVLQSELARYRADELAAAAEPVPQGRLVATALDLDANGLKTIATAIAARPGHVAILTSQTSPVLLVVARATDVAVDAKDLIARVTTELGGRGGGKPELAQAGSIAADPGVVLSTVRRLIG